MILVEYMVFYFKGDCETQEIILRTKKETSRNRHLSTRGRYLDLPPNS